MSAKVVKPRDITPREEERSGAAREKNEANFGNK